MDYSKNFLNMMGGHLTLYDGNGKPNVQDADPTVTKYNDTADIRQILTNVVGNSYKSLSDKDIRADYARLANIVGMSQAQKLLDHAFIFNQRSDSQNIPTDSKVQSFFNMSSSDKQINSIIQTAAKFGDGPVAGMNRSPNVGNQKLSGNYSDLPLSNFGDEALNKIIK